MSFLARFRPDNFTLALAGTVLLASLIPASGNFAQLLERVTSAVILVLFFFAWQQTVTASHLGRHWPLAPALTGHCNNIRLLSPFRLATETGAAVPTTARAGTRRTVSVRPSSHGAIGHRAHRTRARQHPRCRLQCLRLYVDGDCVHTDIGWDVAVALHQRGQPSGCDGKNCCTVALAFCHRPSAAPLDFRPATTRRQQDQNRGSRLYFAGGLFGLQRRCGRWPMAKNARSFQC